MPLGYSKRSLATPPERMKALFSFSSSTTTKMSTGEETNSLFKVSNQF